jgi:hypothetical protein
MNYVLAAAAEMLIAPIDAAPIGNLPENRPKTFRRPEDPVDVRNG